MEEDLNEAVKPVVPQKHQFAKLLIGTAVGFIVTKGVEKAYDAILASRAQTETPETTE